MIVSTSFNQVLDFVEAMPDEEQMILFDLINRRRSERRRDEIAANIAISTTALCFQTRHK